MNKDSNQFLVCQYKSYEMVDAFYKEHDLALATGDFSAFYRLSDSLEQMAEPLHLLVD